MALAQTTANRQAQRIDPPDAPREILCPELGKSASGASSILVCFSVDCTPHPTSAGCYTLRIPPHVKERLQEIFLEAISSRLSHLSGVLHVVLEWYPDPPLTESDFALFRREFGQAILAAQEGKRYESRGPHEADVRPYRVVTQPSLDLIRSATAELLKKTEEAITRFSPEQQRHLGQFLAAEFERSTGDPAAFVTQSTFFSELIGVRGASEQLKRSRAAVTSYAQHGVLPAVRLDDKQYIFFKRQVDQFTPPKRGPKAQPENTPEHRPPNPVIQSDSD
jgi:hypothetical protein